MDELKTKEKETSLGEIYEKHWYKDALTKLIYIRDSVLEDN